MNALYGTEPLVREAVQTKMLAEAITQPRDDLLAKLFESLPEPVVVQETGATINLTA